MLAVTKRLANDPKRLAEFERARHLAKLLIKSLKQNPFKDAPPHVTIAALFLASMSFTDACASSFKDELFDNEKH